MGLSEYISGLGDQGAVKLVDDDALFRHRGFGAGTEGFAFVKDLFQFDLILFNRKQLGLDLFKAVFVLKFFVYRFDQTPGFIGAVDGVLQQIAQFVE